jgi:DUF4097 and DUF4098 domain-containing protein YvlB
MTMTIPVALLALSALQQTDTTLAVPPSARLQVQNQSGSIKVTAWDRSEMRVRAEHGTRDEIRITVRGSVVEVEAERRHGMPAFVDYDITVPKTMTLDLSGQEAEIEVEGVTGGISAESVEGGVTIRGAGGPIEVHTVEGDIVIDGARGEIKVEGVDGDISLSNVVGDLTVETTDGDVTLDNVDATNVDVSTVDGDVSYVGMIKDGGRYGLSTHSGDIEVGTLAGINATVSVATFEGSFEADPAFKVEVTNMRPGRRFSFTLGTGSARVELESFDGDITLERRTPARAF